MNTQLIDRFLAACGTSSPLALRISGPTWPEPLVRELRQPFVVLGRDPKADVCLDAPEVSPAHAYLQVVAGSVFCTDLHSETGTHWPDGTDNAGWLAAGQPLRIGPFSVELDADRLPQTQAFGPPRAWSPLVSRSAQQVSRLPAVSLELVNTADKQPPRRLNRLLALVGSASGCNVRLISSTVAGFHGSLLRTPLGLWVVDLLGGQEVKVNGTAARYALLQDGDELRVGRFRLRVAYEAQPAVTEPAVAANDLVPVANGGVPRHAPTDLSATALAETALARRDEALVGSLVQQFQLMQQQMFDQFQQAMSMVVQMFSTMHHEQTERVRRDLERMRDLTQELQTLQAELKKRHAAESKTPPTPQPAARPVPKRPAQPAAATNGRNGAEPPAPDETIHAWLSDRIAALQQERQSHWQKIVSFLGGKGS